MGIMLDKQILFVFLLPVWIVIRIALFYSSKKRKSGFSLKRELLLNVLFIYILCLISITFFPLNIMFGREHKWVSLNLIPVIGTVKEVTNITNNPNMHNFMIKFWIKNIAGNLLLFFPLGILLPLLWERFRNLTKVIIFAFCLTLSIEILQLLLGYIGNVGRAFDIDDIILNTAGALLGFVFCNIFIKSKIK